MRICFFLAPPLPRMTCELSQVPTRSFVANPPEQAEARTYVLRLLNSILLSDHAVVPKKQEKEEP